MRVALAMWLVAAVLVTTACQGAESAPGVPAAAPPAAPVPAAQQPVSRQPTPPCDLRASLRPQGPLPVPNQMPTGSTMDRIHQRGWLIAGVNQNAYRFGSRDPSSGELVGFEIDIVRDLAQAIFGDPTRVRFRELSAADRVQAIETGEVDVMVSTMTITCERRERVEFSTVYYEAGQRVVVPKDAAVTGINDLSGKRVCAARGSTSVRNILRTPEGPIPVGVNNASDCLVLLQLGQVEAISTDDAVLLGMVAQDPQTKIVGERFSQEPYGVAVHHEATDLVRFVNAVLERRLASGGWQTSYERWLSPLGAASQPPQPRYRD